jgi:MFS family permease
MKPACRYARPPFDYPRNRLQPESEVLVGERRYGWVMVALGAFMTCIAIGAMFSLAVFLRPITEATGWSNTAVLLGRLAFGVAADRFGVKRVLIAGLLIQALAAGTFVAASRLGEFYAVAATFGFAYGGVMPLYAVLAREYFGQRILGAVFGAAAMVSSLGMALGPALGGWIFDTFGRYTWMYLGSAAIGLGAVAIALAFPPFPGRSVPLTLKEAT